LGDVSGAIASLERAIQINPQLIKAHVTLAQAYQKAARTEDAQNESRRVAVLTAEQRGLGRAMVLLQSARQRLDARDSRKALADLREAVAASPHFAEANLQLGRTLRETGDAGEALRVLQQARNLDPERADIHYEIGLTLQQMGRITDALNEFRTTVEMAPCHVEAKRQLGRAALMAPDRAEALDDFRGVLALSPDDREARNAIHEILARESSGQNAKP
jgi:tetratricopeptide (TPR) repeat protein